MKNIAATALLALFLAAPASPATTLTGTVGPGFTITLKAGSAKVTKLKAGKYTINISDKSGIHNFHLSGPGVSKKTSVGGTGSQTWTVTLKKGKFHYQCDAHPTIMFGNFTVA
jgi:hypothetical protein